MLLLPLLLLPALAQAIPTTDADAVCSFLFDKYPRYVAWDPLNINAIESIANATRWINSTSKFWAGQQSKNRATCAFFPESAEQVSTAVKKLNEYSSVPFAIKSGGHQFNTGFSSVDKGVLISFNENLSSVVRSADGKSFVVGTGARWGDAYTVADKTNQVVVGGRLSNIGVGGFILGGGLSYYSSQYGMACDNVINFEAVLPDGTIANINSQSYTDLFWALKGGGNRFAIVTRYTLQGHPGGNGNGNVWGGTRVYSPDQREKIFAAVAQFTENYSDHPKAAVIPTYTFAGPLGIIQAPFLFLFYDGEQPPASVFADFDAIPSLSDSTKTRRYPDMANEAGGAAISGLRTAARVTTFPNIETSKMVEFYEDQYQIYAKRTVNDTLKSIDFQLFNLATQPVSVQVAKASQAQGGNAMDLNPNYGDRIWVENDILWINPMCDRLSACTQHLREAADAVDAIQAQKFPNERPTNYKSGDVKFVSKNPLFMNDAGYYQDVYASYGATNEARLRSIQQKYDPKRFMFRQDGFNFF